MASANTDALHELVPPRLVGSASPNDPEGQGPWFACTLQPLGPAPRGSTAVASRDASSVHGAPTNGASSDGAFLVQPQYVPSKADGPPTIRSLVFIRKAEAGTLDTCPPSDFAVVVTPSSGGGTGWWVNSYDGQKSRQAPLSRDMRFAPVAITPAPAAGTGGAGGSAKSVSFRVDGTDYRLSVDADAVRRC